MVEHYKERKREDRQTNSIEGQFILHDTFVSTGLNDKETYLS